MTDGEMTLEETVALERHRYIRIYASDVASLTGFNPHCNFVDVFLNYLYQGCESLMECDVIKLQQLQIDLKEEEKIQFISEKESILTILNKLPEEERVNLKSILKDSYKD